MAPRHGKKAKKLSVVELLDADSDELNLIHPNSTTSLNSDNEEQLEDKLSSDSEDDEEDEEGEGEDEEEEGSGPIPSPPPTVSKKRKRTRKSESFVS
jgi:hypothetical protein